MKAQTTLANEQNKKHFSNRNPLRDFSSSNISTGIISGMLAMTGPPAIILEAASAGGFSNEQTISWMFAVYFFGGIFGILFPLIYKIPITGAHSLSGVAFLVTITPYYSFPELVAAYIIAGAIIFIIGITGLFSKIMKWFPKEIIAAMLGGLITTYVVRLVVSIQDLAIVGIPAIISFFIFTKWVKRVPAVLGAVLTALVMVLITQDISGISTGVDYVFPSIYKLDFTLMGVFTISIPLALLILSNDAAPGIGALESERYDPPTGKIITASGFFTMIAGLFGGQSANIAGMMSAICADDQAGKKEKRYIAALVSGVLLLLFGIFAWKIVRFIQILPDSFIAMLAGFALIGMLGSSVQQGFSEKRFRLGSTFAFVITLSDISFYYISAPVIGLVVGSFISKVIENKD